MRCSAYAASLSVGDLRVAMQSVKPGGSITLTGGSITLTSGVLAQHPISGSAAAHQVDPTH